VAAEKVHPSPSAGEVGSRSEQGQVAAREGWRRKADWLELQPTEIAALLRPVIGDRPILSAQRVTGGLVNTNLKVALSDPPYTLLLRLFQREPLKAQIEVALDRLLDGRVPRARFLHFDETNPVTGHPYAVLQWIDGVQLGAAASTADSPALVELGARVGAAMAEIHSFRFDRCGFFAADLSVPAAIDLDRAALLGFMRECLRDGPGGERLGAELTAGLFAFVEREGDRLNAWLDVPTLAHADFNPSNILVLRDADAWRVAAVLDWEFALSATPAMDFGNLLRPPFGSRSGFVEALARGYKAAGGFLPDDWLRIARIADLFAWADLMGRRSEDSALTADARRIIAATFETNCSSSLAGGEWGEGAVRSAVDEGAT
jgi:aminoglycoside phosphotransferase (APT) family kinase protein